MFIGILVRYWPAYYIKHIPKFKFKNFLYLFYFLFSACYIDIDEEIDVDLDPNHEYSNWSCLPDIILEQIFSYLPVKDRYYASLVIEFE